MMPFFKKRISFSDHNNLEERGINLNLFLDHFSFHDKLLDDKFNFDEYFNKTCKSKIQKNNNLKKILRNPNISVSTFTRSILWLSLMGGLKGNEIYTCSEFEKFDVEANHRPSFVNKSFETNYFLNDKGRKDAYRILSYIAYVNPNFSYCPLLYFMCNVFLHYFDSSVSMAILQNMIENSDFFGIGFSHSANEKLAYVHKHFCGQFSKNGFNLSSHSHSSPADWISCLFYVLPFAYLVRILDCYAFEGIKVIIRFGVAVAHYIEKNKHVFNSSNPSNTLDFETWKSHFSRTNVSLDKLFRKAFRLSISRYKISLLMKLPVKKESFVSYCSQKSTRSNLGGIQRLNLYYVTELTPVNSLILDEHHFRVLWSWLPFRMLAKDPKLIFTTREHGWSLTTFYSKCAQWENVFVFYEVMTGEKFGFFSPVELNVTHNASRYYGTGETFVFTIHPKLKNFPWVGIAKHGRTNHNEEMFIAGDSKLLIVGGGGGEAIFIQDDLFEGRSEHCDTFDNDPLVDGSDFVCKIVEVVGLY